jgi:hypothetical protein
MEKTGREDSLKFPRIAFVFLLIFAPSGLPAAKGKYAAAPSNYEMVEAPTAYTLLHGGYDLIARMYEGGGLFVRGNIGFKDRLMLGFSGNATNVIGHGDIDVQEPRLAVKWKILDQGRAPVALAAAWDDRGYGETFSRRFFPGLQKGFYSVVSREFKKAGYLQLHGGANVVSFSDFESERDLGFFGGLSFALHRSFVLNAEVDKVPAEFWQFNAGFLLAFDEPVRLGMDFRDINRSESFARILRLQCLSFF